MAYLYRHIRLDTNQPFYVGIGSDNEGEFIRAFQKGRNKYWNNIVNKTEYHIEIILDDLTWEDACLKEQEFIKLYGRKNLKTGSLVNLTDGGEGTLNTIISDETRKKMSDFQKGNKHRVGKLHNEETKEKISEALQGNKIWVGKTHTEETKQKISKANKGKPAAFKGRTHSEESLKKMSEAKKGNQNHKGFKHSDETKRKIGIKSAQKTPWNKGKSWSDEVRKKMSESAKNRKKR